MPQYPSTEANDAAAFQPTAAVVASRTSSRYLDCSVCQADHSEYLFHKVGVRFVRCRSCGMVYVNPVSDAGPNYFDIERIGQFDNAEDRAICARDFETFLEQVEAQYERVEGRKPKTALLLGRYLAEFRESAVARRTGLDIAEVNDATFRQVVTGANVDCIPKLKSGADVIILHEFLEAATDPAAVLQEVIAALLPRTWIVTTYSNAQSLPAILLRRFWPPFLDRKSAFFNTNNVAALMSRFGFVMTAQFPFPVTLSAGYLMKRVLPNSLSTRLVRATPVRHLAAPLRTGAHAALFRRPLSPAPAKEKLSIVLPVYNEAGSVEQLLTTLLAKKLKIDREVIIVESNSSDGTRAIVQKFANHAGVKLILEERPQGKGHAVRTGLKAVTGSIVIIQDADLEYDIDDYDALLEPILQHRTAFVLGSRSLGLDDWKVRRFARGASKGMLLNFGQIIFARTFNLLYQQHVTDVNTMFKVFRVECLEGLNLTSDGFDLDIELACKLVRNGNGPMEVPVNYVARGFDEGKKIRFFRDAVPTYAAFFKYRFR